MRSGVLILVAAVLLGARATMALAEGPYDGSSYWDKVERSQECAWKAQESPYPPAFAYGPSESCAYGAPGAQYYYAPPPATPRPYSYSSHPAAPYYYR
jgi:hypothetical protein